MNKINKETHKLNKIIFGILIIYVVIAFIIGFVTYDKNLAKFSLSSNTINTVSFVNKDNSTSFINLPAKIKGSDSFEFTLDISNYQNIDNCSISTFASFSNLRVYADDKLIYQKQTSTDDFLGSGGYYLVFFELPAKIKSPHIKFVYDPLVKSSDYTYLPLIRIGNKTRIILSELLGKIDLIVLLLLLALNFINIVMVLLLRKSFFKDHNYGAVHLSILALIVAIYFMTQSWFFKYLMLPVHKAMYFVEYTSLAAMPIPLLVFFKYQLNNKLNKIYDYLIFLSCANLIIHTIVAFSKIVELSYILPLSHTLIFLTLILIAANFIISDKDEYPKKRRFMLPFAVLVPAATIPIISYIINNEIIYSSTGTIISISFILLELIEVYIKFTEAQNDRIEKEIYHRLAHVDTLTNLNNRASYNNFISNFYSSEDISSGYFVSIDLNGLKRINDKHGHINGDTFIVNFANLLKEEESKINNLQAYRIGGDEFFIFISDNDEFEIDTWIQALKESFAKTDDFGENTPPSFACGYFYIDKDSHIDFEKAYNEADKRMYEDKKQYKLSSL